MYASAQSSFVGSPTLKCKYPQRLPPASPPGAWDEKETSMSGKQASNPWVLYLTVESSLTEAWCTGQNSNAASFGQ